MVKKVEYQVIQSIENVEIRNYPKLLLATVTGFDDNSAFNILFNFISGSNRTKQKVQMTVPVISSQNSQNIEMTAPVISSKNSMSFIMPAKYSLCNIPSPTDSRVKIVEQPESRIAVIQFKGYARPRDVNKFSSELLAVLLKNNIKVKGKPFLMRYNAPFVPGIFRRNEIGIKIPD